MNYSKDTQHWQEVGSWQSTSNRFFITGYGIVTVLISVGFFLDGLQASFANLSGDQVNILTVCAKRDYPHLLEGDLVVGDSGNTDYYIPLFVNLVRFFSLPDHNYLRGLNILLLFTSLLYMWGWWRLFSVWGDKWIAAILAFLARGIMWPPGHELWGIAGLWTMLPRTAFLSLLPWVMWAWMCWRQVWLGWLLVCFSCGLLANVHPISGVGVGLSLLLADVCWTMTVSRNVAVLVSRCIGGAAAMLLGMFPYIWAYWLGLGSMAGVDPVEFDQALGLRVSSRFFDPVLYLHWWLQPKWLMLVFGPWLVCLALTRREPGVYKAAMVAQGGFALGCVLTALGPFLIERILRDFGYSACFAFQLVRTGKYVIIPSLLLTALGCTIAHRELMRCSTYRGALSVSIVVLVILLTLISPHPVFDQVPALGDSVCRSLWPPWIYSGRASDRGNASLEALLQWIKENTPEDAKFIGPSLIRIGSLRAVIHDTKGAGMLIEGNPRQFVQWARRERRLRGPEYRDPVARSELFCSWGAQYWVTTKHTPDLRLVYSNSGWFVYFLGACDLARTSPVLRRVPTVRE